MKCPLCNEELEVYDKDYNFKGNYDIYADCNACHRSFILYYRYGHLWKYNYDDLEYNEKDKQWYAKPGTSTTVTVWKGEKDETFGKER